MVGGVIESGGYNVGVYWVKVGEGCLLVGFKISKKNKFFKVDRYILRFKFKFFVCCR